MPATPDDLFSFLDRLGIAHRTVSHDAAFTVADAQALRGSIAGAHTKNLFLKDRKGALFLLVTMEDAAIRLNHLHHALGSARLSFGAPALLMDALGVAPGSVTPFAALNDRDRRVTIVLDALMMRHETLNFHPLDNRMTTTIGRQALLDFFRATGHDPRTVDLRDAAGPAGGRAGASQTD